MTAVSNKSFTVKFLLFSIAFSVVCLSVGAISLFLGEKDGSPVLQAEGERLCLILDPGHGGIDGGATGINGVLEKDINLSLANEFAALLHLCDIDVIMTRTEDISLGEDAPRGKKKMTDLKKRLQIAEDAPDALFLSIHMNKYPSEECRGMQIWYSKNNEKSRRFADIMQNYIKNGIGLGSARETKVANSAIYILDRINNPAILAECGFLSNSEECNALCGVGYRQKIIVTMLAAICDFDKNVG